jgi:hypothetical protein
MDGPDHYRHSEMLAAVAEKHLNSEDTQGTVANYIALAQVHATLALAAAAADRAPGWQDFLHPRPELSRRRPDRQMGSDGRLSATRHPAAGTGESLQ